MKNKREGQKNYQKCRKNDHFDMKYCIKKQNDYNKNKI